MGKVNNRRLFQLLSLICMGMFLMPAYGQRGEISDVLWKYPTGGRIIGLTESPRTGWIYALSEDRMIYALRKDGVLLWRSERFQNKPLPLLITGPDGTIYGQTVDNELYAVNPAGRVVWRVKLSGKITGTPLIRSDGAFTYTTSAGIEAARTHLGKLIWYSRGEGSRIDDGKDPLHYEDGHQHLIMEGRIVKALSTGGKLLWSVEVGAATVSFSVGPHTLVLVSAFGEVMMLNRHDGSLIWKKSDLPSGTATLVTSSGAFIIGGDDWVVYRVRRPDSPIRIEAGDGWETTDSVGEGKKAVKKEAREIYRALLFESASRDILLDVLEENRSHLSAPDTLEQFDSNLATVEKLAGFGMLNPEFKAGRLINDFPVVRTRAVRILSEFGTLHSRDMLLKIVKYEWDPTVKLEAVRALGILRSDPDGEVIETLHHLSKEGSLKYENDPLLAAALIRTADSLTRYGGLVRVSSSQLLNEIYFSTLPRNLRLSAMETLRSFRKEEVY